jgi:hypothetical protein
MAVREYYIPGPTFQLQAELISYIHTKAFALAAPMATSLIGGGPATMIWG